MSRSENNKRVESLISGAHKTHVGWRANCPFCAEGGHRDRKTSLVIMGSGKWWCFRCDTHGRLKEAPDPYAAAQRTIEYIKNKDKDEWKIFDPPQYFVPLAGDDSETFRDARQYMLERGVSNRVIESLGIGACYSGRWNGRIIVPIIREPDRAWLGWVGRLWRNKAHESAQGLSALKYLYPAGMQRDRIIYNVNVLSTETIEPAMLVEGAFDCFPFPDRAFAVLGKLGETQRVAIAKRLERPLAVVLDGDAWVQGHAIALSFQNNGFAAGCVRLPPRKDPDEMDYNKLIAACRACIGKQDPVRL